MKWKLFIQIENKQEEEKSDLGKRKALDEINELLHEKRQMRKRMKKIVYNIQTQQNVMKNQNFICNLPEGIREKEQTKLIKQFQLYHHMFKPKIGDLKQFVKNLEIKVASE